MLRRLEELLDFACIKCGRYQTFRLAPAGIGLLKDSSGSFRIADKNSLGIFGCDYCGAMEQINKTIKQRTANLDEHTCQYCSEKDGTVIDDYSKIPRRDDPKCTNDLHRCRCVAVSQCIKAQIEPLELSQKEKDYIAGLKETMQYIEDKIREALSIPKRYFTGTDDETKN